MLFNIIFFVLVAAIAYFHYAQGLFSAAISAALAVLAAMLAIGYHEWLASYLHSIPDEADAVALCGIFLCAYLIPRLAFDNIVPGNIRFPVLLDKIGSGVLGLIAGIFATGVLAIAAQSLPFDPIIGGYARQTMTTDPRNVVVQTGGRGSDSSVGDQLVGDYLGDPAQMQHLWLHQDDIVLGLARQLSDTGGSLANGAALAAAHPDYPTELFGQRMGIPGGTRHLLVNPDKGGGVKATLAYLLPKAPPAMDGEVSAIRGEMQPPDLQPDTLLVVVRVTFANTPPILDPNETALHLSPAGVRLQAGLTDYYPVGTMIGASLLLKNRADDPLIIDLSKGAKAVDFLFEINPDDLNVQSANNVKKTRFKPGSFLEVQRYALSDLSGMEIRSDVPETAVEPQGDGATETLGGVMRKFDVLTSALKRLNTVRSPAADQAPSKNPPPANLRQNDDLLPTLPNHFMGL
jgi:hypothetical protein